MSARTFGREWISARIKLSVALFLSLLLLGAGASEARAAGEVATKTFDPVRKTQRALIFNLRGVEPARVVRAQPRMRLARKRIRRQLKRKPRFQGRPAAMRRAYRRAQRRLQRRIRRQVDVRRVRNVVARGEPLRLRKPQRIRGARVQIVEEATEPTPRLPDSDILPPEGDVYTVPSSVPSGCSTDATSQILSWVASVPDDSTLRFDPGACYRIEGTLEVRGRSLTLDGNGATFRSLDPPTSHRALWRAHDSRLAFRDMTLAGSYADGGTHTDSLQWAHGIDLRGTHAVIENVAISDVSGDCVYFGLGAGRSSGAVRDSSCRRTGRNGVSVVAGDDIRVERTTTDRIGFIAFDVEPNGGPGNGSDRVVFDSNTIGSYYLYAWAVFGKYAPSADQAFTNNRVVGQGLRIAAISPTYRLERLAISGNSSDTAQRSLAMDFSAVDGLTVTGNVVPLSSGTMAQVTNSCQVNVSGNSYPGGSREVSIVDPAC